MNHGNGGGWKMMLGMLLCCAAMVGVFLFLGIGVASFR